MMDKTAIQKYFFTGTLLLVSALVFFMFLPFFEVLVLSVIFATVLSPLQFKLSSFFNGRKGLASIVIVILFIIVVIIPAVLLVFQVLDESKDIYLRLTNHSEIDYIQKITLALERPIQKIYPSFSINIGELASLSADWVTSHLTAIVSSVLNIATGIVLIFVSLFFFLRDGKEFRDILIDLSPLSDRNDEKIFTKLAGAVTATVRGVILVSIVQGFLAGLGMWIFGIPNPTLWGSISAIASLIPGLGTAVIFIPAVIYMYIIGNIPFAVGLLLWGALIVGLVDNFLTPFLYSRGVEVHQLIMLFAVLGGLVFFGPIGFIFGPIVITLFFSLIEIYQDIILKNNSL